MVRHFHGPAEMLVRYNETVMTTITPASERRLIMRLHWLPVWVTDDPVRIFAGQYGKVTEINHEIPSDMCHMYDNARDGTVTVIMTVDERKVTSILHTLEICDYFGDHISYFRGYEGITFFTFFVIMCPQGQAFSGLDHRVYLLGNPVIFWLNIATFVVFPVMYAIHAILIQRRVKSTPDILAWKQNVFGACWWLTLAFVLHYAPFWPMTRVLYFHHFFPAFLFSCMLSGVVIDFLITQVSIAMPHQHSSMTFHLLTGVVLAVIAYSFYLFHPLTYGMSGERSHNVTSVMYGLQWLRTWDF